LVSIITLYEIILLRGRKKGMLNSFRAFPRIFSTFSIGVYIVSIVEVDSNLKYSFD